MAPTSQTLRDDQIKQQIAAVKAEIKDLESHHALLQQVLRVDPRATRKLLAYRATVTDPREIARIDKVVAECDAARRKHEQEWRRIAAGITTFPCQDPDPRAVDGGRIVGIRIDVPPTFAKATEALKSGGGEGAGFGIPYYIFLVRPWVPHHEGCVHFAQPLWRSNYGFLFVDMDRFRVHKHTIPAWVDLRALEEMYLPPPAVAGRPSVQRVEDFARAVRREMLGSLAEG